MSQPALMHERLLEGPEGIAEWNASRRAGTELTATDLANAELANADLRDADLRGANLTDADLRGADLRDAELAGADLRGAKLERAKLQGASLRGARLQGSDLSGLDVEGTRLQGAQLDNANLSNVTSLIAEQIAGADVTNAQLPPNVGQLKALETAEEAARNSRGIFYVMLGASAYSWLTVASTSDLDLLTNSAVVELPILGTRVPILWIFYGAPILLLFALVYFQLYLQQVWRALASLPAVFPDGRSLDEHAYPWLMTVLVRRYVPLLRERPLVARAQELCSLVLGLWVVPLTLFGIWYRFLDRQEFGESLVHIGCTTLAVWCASWFQRLLRETFERATEGVARPSLANAGAAPERGARARTAFYPGLRVRRWAGSASISLAAFAAMSTATLVLRGDNGLSIQLPQIVSQEPENAYTLSDDQLEFAVRGADFHGRNLTGAMARGSVLLKSDFEGADLTAAQFDRAKLAFARFVGARLRGARLSEANLSRARLASADLSHADLSGAKLMGADLSGSDLTGADCNGTNFASATLRGAKLRGTDLREARLGGAGLDGADLTGSELEGATLDGASYDAHTIFPAGFDAAAAGLSVGAEYRFKR